MPSDLHYNPIQHCSIHNIVLHCISWQRNDIQRITTYYVHRTALHCIASHCISTYHITPSRKLVHYTTLVNNTLQDIK